MWSFRFISTLFLNCNVLVHFGSSFTYPPPCFEIVMFCPKPKLRQTQETVLLRLLSKTLVYTSENITNVFIMLCSSSIRQDIKTKYDAVTGVDIISHLPCSIIDNILVCLPLRDVVRTSILSREWRYKWLNCPELVFDIWFDRRLLKCHKLEPVIQHILSHHQGPLQKLAIQVSSLKSCPEIDDWVHLLPNATLRDLTLQVSIGKKHKLTSHMCTFRKLRNLMLYNCAFDHPPGFKGFGKLVNLDLQNVALVPDRFGEFITSCPTVESLRLVHCTMFDCLEITGPKLKFLDFVGVFRSVSFIKCPALSVVRLTFSSLDFREAKGFSFDLVTSLSCLPALEELHLQASALEDLVEYGAPNKLSVSLYMLKTLHLTDMYFEKAAETSCAICFFSSCPNLQSLKITAFTLDSVVGVLQSRKPLARMTHLKTVNIQLFCGIEPEMEFVKYLLASATALEELAFRPHPCSVTDRGEAILSKLQQYPRASSIANIISLDMLS